MSEYINNVSKRKEAIKQIIRLLHEGKTVEELQVEYGHIIAGASAQDIAAAERYRQRLGREFPGAVQQNSGG